MVTHQSTSATTRVPCTIVITGITLNTELPGNNLLTVASQVLPRARSSEAKNRNQGWRVTNLEISEQTCTEVCLLTKYLQQQYLIQQQHRIDCGISSSILGNVLPLL